MDRLDALLARFSLKARMFHSGPLCGVVDFGADDGVGQLHLLKRGPLRVEHAARRKAERVHAIDEPSVVFYPRPLDHRFVADPQVGADMACANVHWGGGAMDPIARALPAFVCIPLAQLPRAGAVFDLLFDEAFHPRCGHGAVVDRLFEVALIHVLRELMQAGRVDAGLLAGMAHPQIAKALVAMHESPANPWTLESLAGVAGLSRSRFAECFRDVLDETPGDYLARWRVSVAQDLLRRGRPVKAVASEVGYGSSAALSRAFTAITGESPRMWLANRR